MKMAGRSTVFCLGVTLCLCLGMTACGGGSISTTPPPNQTTPGVTVTPSAPSITTAQGLTVTVTVAGSPTPTGSVTLSSGSYTSSATALSSGSASINIAAGALAAGTDTLTVNYTPDAGSSSTYNSASGTATVTVTAPALIAPTVTVTPGSLNITTAQALTVTVAVSGGAGNPTPSGSVTLTSGSYTSSAATLASGGTTINIPAGALATGSDTLTVAYTPDSGSSATYKSASGTASVTVTTPALIAPTVTVTPGSMSIPATQALTVTVGVSAAAGNPTPTGSVTLTGGGYASAATTLTAGSASINIPAGSLAAGSDTLTATYTPDAGSSSTYKSATGTGSVTVTSAATYTLTIDSAGPSSGISINVSPNDNNAQGTGTTPFTRTYNAGALVTLSAPLSFNTFSFVSWTGCTPVSGTPSNCTATMNANTTVTATFNEPQITSITLACTTVSTKASCNDTSTTGTVAIGTQAQFAATVNGTGSISKSVTWSMSCPACGSLSPGDFSATSTTAATYNTPYPAPATVVITATSVSTPSISGSMTVTLSAPSVTGPALAVDVNTPGTPSENPHTISPLIYGLNGYTLDTASAKIASPSVIRWGGDDTSRYNYQNQMTNSASDYYFENFEGAASMPGGGGFNNFITSNIGVGAESLGTVPVLGWVSNGTQFACSFTQATYPNQQSFQNGCGNGVGTNGTDLVGNSTVAAITSLSEPAPDITAASTPAPGASNLVSWANGTWAGGWVNSLVANPSYGNGASGKGVAIWDLDNEPTWWDAVHRDVHPIPFTYDEVTNGGVGTALAIKTADPTALVSGPVMDNWWAYFYSKKDIENGYTQGPCYEPWSGPTDRTAHGGVSMLEYYLQQFNSYSQKYGVRLLDYLDVHSYFAPNYNGNSVAFATAGDTQEQMARMNGTRVFWDSTYTDPNFPQPNYITDANYTANCSTPLQAPQVIPMLQKWVAADYPGTKTAIDEYNFGGLESINGAVVQADILGIFGRQGLDMGDLWPSNGFASEQPGNYAFAMYRNYDLKNDGAVFGDAYLHAASTGSSGDAEGQLAVYGAQRSSDGAITVMVINKTYGPLTSTLSLQNFAGTSTSAQVYLYSSANLSAIVSQPAATITLPSGGGTTGTLSYTFPAQSITLLVIPN